MPLLSEEERKKGQERGQAYTSVTGQQAANVAQQQQQQVQSQNVEQRTQQALQPPEQVLPPVDQWDYQTSQIGPHGEQLPPGSQGWKPDGKPFFGDGITGKLKEYWWNFTKDVPGTASVQEMTDLWNQSKKTIQQDKSVPYWQKDNQYAEQFRENIASAFSGRGTPLTDEETARQRELVTKRQAGNALSAQEQQELRELSRGAVDRSSLSGTRRLVNTALSAGLDLINVPAEIAERTLGAVRGGAEELAEQAGRDVPGEEAAQLTQERKDNYKAMVDSGEINPHAQPPSITWQEAKNNLKNTLINSPLGIAYNTIQLALSPNGGDWDAVKNAMDKGWDSGRILYTQVYDPMMRYEYERRLDQGENPELLAMELANPWAEMVGQVILDPLNIIGVGAKGAKVAGKIDEAKDAVRPMIKLLDEDMDVGVALFREASTDEGALRAVREITESYVEKTIQRAEVRAQKYGWTQLTSTSQKNLLKKDMNNFFGTVIGGLTKDGRHADDIADILKYGVMSVSDNADEAMEGIAGLMNANVPKAFFSELGNDSLSTVRRMLTNADGALDPQKIYKALSGDNPVEAVMKVTDEAAAQRFASVQEMEKAAEAVKAGTAGEKEIKLARAYEEVPEHVKLFTKTVEPAEKAKNITNSGLGFFYFTINPGTAVRNKISNVLFSLWDSGPKAFFDNGVFKAQTDIEEGLTKHLGRKYEVGSTFGSQAGKAPNLMAKFEAADALRVIETRYMDAFGRITDTALPFEDALKQAGMTNSQFNLFKELVKKEGDLSSAMTAFNKAQGVADWRTLDFLNPTQVRGLKQSGNVWNDLLDLATNPNASLDDVNKFIDARVKSYADNAQRAADDVPGFSHQWDSSEEAAKYVGRAVEEGHVSNADYTKLGQIQEASEQAIDAYKSVLDKQIRLLPDGPIKDQMLGKLSDMLMQADAGGKEVRRVVDGMWEKVYSTKDAIRKGDLSVMEPAWKEFGFDAPMPAQAQQYIDEMFDNARVRRSALWEEHFSTAIAQSESLIGDLAEAGQDVNDLTNLFQRARDLDAQAQKFKSAVYMKNGKAFTGAPPKGTKLGQMDYEGTNKFLQELGWDRGSADGLKNAVNKDRRAKDLKPYEKWQDVTWDEALESVGKRTQVDEAAVGLEKAAEVPRNELPENVSQRIADEARRLLSDLRSGQPAGETSLRATEARELGAGAEEVGRTSTRQSDVFGKKTPGTIEYGTTNAQWYRDLPRNLQRRDALDNALNKIIEDAGKDKGVNVERMKDLIIDNFTFGDEATGTPPDLNVLKSLGADDDTLNSALDAFNDITGQNMNLDEALRASGYVEEAAPAKGPLTINIDEAERAKGVESFKASTDIDALKSKAKATREAGKIATETGRPFKEVLDELLGQTEKVIPVHPAGAEPSIPRQFLETQKGFTETMEYVRSYVTENWGKISKKDDVVVSQALAEYVPKYTNRITDAKAMAIKNAEYWRDFTLLGYDTGKKYGNLAAAYAMPYNFWYSGTYRNMMDRLVTDPQVIAGYAKYKKAVEQENRFAPEWYRQQVRVDNVFGIELDNPLFFNLEATLNPLNGLTGPDFMDKSKRVDWWTSTLDDMGKFGPSAWAPIQVATAIAFSVQGDQDTALRWAGRLAPQSPAIKAISSLAFGKPVEVDPLTLAFGGDKPFDFFGAMDSYERGRVARALGDVQQREIDEIMASNMPSEQKQAAIAELEAKYTEIAYTQEGPEWDEAYRLATNLRAPGQITSPLLGVGFKARTQVDIEIDEMYGQMGQLFAMRDGMSPEDYQKGWQQLREKYPFSDTVLLARKGGDLRDSAYAYNIMSRVPPGRTDDVFRELKIDDLRQKFYDDKGDMSTWNEQDKSRFMDAVIDIGATLAIPPDSTREEWTAAKDASGDMYSYLKDVYGDDIVEKAQTYYGIRDGSYQDGKLYLEAHPEINDYLNDKTSIVAQNPLLFKYYGSLQTIESYYQSELRSELAQKHGEDIFNIVGAYSSLPKYTDARKVWREENPEQYDRLRAYWDDYYSEETQRNVNDAIVRMYDRLPKTPEPLLRGEPESIVQQTIAEQAARQQMTAQQIVSEMPAPLVELVEMYFEGESLPDEAIDELNRIGGRYGMNANDIILTLQIR